MNITAQADFRLQAFEIQADFLKILTHPARLAILELLREGEQCVCHLEAHLGLRQAYISQQLAVLREAGLIQDRRDGWNVFYHVADPRVFAVITAVRQMVSAPEPPGPAPVVNCPCPRCGTQEAGRGDPVSKEISD